MLARRELDEIGQHLLGGAEYLEKHGWCQHTLEDNDKVCMIGSVARSIKPEGPNVYYGMSSEQSILWHQAILRLSHYLGEDPCYFNNAADRTKQQVVDKLKEIAYAPQFAKL